MVAIGSPLSILKSNECSTSAWFTPYATEGWWRHSFSHLCNWNQQADEVFSASSSIDRVRFSADGKYLATGCKHTAQIYDTKTGVETWFGLLLVYVDRRGP